MADTTNMRQAKGISPTEADIGRKVIYRREWCDVEYGFITSFNNKFVFVRYGRGSTSQATDPADLDWDS
jgi:hypothetical protein